MARPKKAVRDLVFQRAKGRCEFCRSPAAFAHQSFSLEHIRPRSRQGNERLGNLALSCQGCNNHKYNQMKSRDPISNEDTRLFNPRRDKWSTHFAWTDDATETLGLTAIGRATVEALKLNRDALINLRRVLVKAGEHPPRDTPF
jgi:HNH endonuclease